MSNDKNEQIVDYIMEICYLSARKGLFIDDTPSGLNVKLKIVDMGDETREIKQRFIYAMALLLAESNGISEEMFLDLGGRFPGDECY